MTAKKKPRLLVTASTFPRWKNDSEPRFVLDLSKALTRYYDVTVLTPSSPGAERKELLEGVKVIRYHYFPIHHFETLCAPGAIVPRIREKKIRAFLVPFLFFSLWINLKVLSSKFDIIHAHWLIPQGIVQMFIKSQYVVTGHGADVTSLNSGILRKMKARCLKKAAGVTVVSQALRDVVIQIEPSCNPEVLPMGCDLTKFSPSHRIENCFGQGGRKVVLFVGRLAEKKGVTYLIEAMKQIEGVLVIVGGGPLNDSLREQAKELGDKIMFMGSKTHDELVSLYPSADVFVAPSITAKDGDKEGFGLVILEAMASGLPVVASDSGGIRDLVVPEFNGYLTEEKDPDDIAEKVKKVLSSDGKEYERLREGALKTAAQYDYNIIAAKYRNLFGV